ncbi:MAG: GvpL/GvpF family gas vesicle protein [Solirubrobacterales bacterium]|nr:GvpL/GvpF family gas vesicle protein [Solirubrobacterales bacterium]MBV9364518.1 GvpL/GvpF family gas vesicle protein [Solirubrobacterales bacterium]MBV9810880.1 GvpL/GvpF family gas vesicle protein [Solirubrobacterales bacterium]
MAQYVYGIVEAGTVKPRVRGIGGAPLALVASEDAAALVSEVASGNVRLGRDEVLLHSKVLERAFARGPVLPMRFGVVMSDAEEVRSRLLEEHGPELRAQLAEFAGKAEIRIRATYDEDTLLHEVVREHPQIASLREAVRGGSENATYYERIRLGELVAAAIQRRREHDARAIVDALAAAALAVEVGQPAHERVAVQASFLVDRERLAEFDKILDGVAADYAGRIRFKSVGPLPPHSFVELAQRA